MFQGEKIHNCECSVETFISVCFSFKALNWVKKGAELSPNKFSASENIFEPH